MTVLLKENEIKKGAWIIREGGTVAFRTETVYGLGADATKEDSIKKIFDAKNRPAVNPLIVHFACNKDIFKFFQDVDEQTKKVLRKVKTALTVIIPRGEKLPSIVSGGLDTVAVRVPSCKFARKFIKACGVPIAAPSANTSTRPSPTSWRSVYDDMKNRIDAVFMGDDTKIGLESTVVKVEPNKILVFRLGGYSTEKLRKKTGLFVEVIADKTKTSASPGTRFKHYAPNCPFVVAKHSETMAERINEYTKSKKAVVLCRSENAKAYHSQVIKLGNNAKQIAKNLFSALREAEKESDVIVCEGFPDIVEFEAINERIARASEGKII